MAIETENAEAAVPAGPTEHARARAEHVVQQIIDRWAARGMLDERSVASLRDRVLASLAGEADHHLRQLLARITTELELAAASDEANGVDSALLGRLPDLMDALDRAQEVVEAFLDANEITQLIIQLHLRTFDLSEDLKRKIQTLGLAGGATGLDVDLAETRIEADPLKLVDSLLHVIYEIQDHAPPDQATHVQLGPQGSQAVGFVGVHGDSLPPETLLKALDAPLNLEQDTIDMAYVRAVIERHGGTISVQRSGDLVGYGFTLPRKQGSKR